MGEPDRVALVDDDAALLPASLLGPTRPQELVLYHGRNASRRA